MTLSPTWIGIDVSKAWIDVADPAGGHNGRVVNRPAQLAAFADALAGRKVTAVFEATGSYDTALRHALATAGVAQMRVNPQRARDFARATGRRDQLVAMRMQEKTRRADADDGAIADDLDSHVAWLGQAIAKVEKAMRQLLDASAHGDDRSARAHHAGHRRRHRSRSHRPPARTRTAFGQATRHAGRIGAAQQ